MPNLAWEQTQFRGIHTQPAKTADGHLYAEDMENLRIDGEGWLQLRSDVMAMGPDGGNITGVATTPSHVFLLREGSKLYVRESNALETEIEIEDVLDLKGRISVVNFNTYVILTSEGADRGYIVDMREGDGQYQAYPLGFDAPGPDSYRAEAIDDIPGGVEQRFYNLPIGTEPKLTNNTYYHYTYTYVSLNDTEDPWYEMESNPPKITLLDDLLEGYDSISEVRGFVYIGVGTGGFFGIGADRNIASKIHIAYSRPAAATHIRIYRSAGVENRVLTKEDLLEIRRDEFIKSQVENLEYRLVAEIPISQASGSFDFYDGMSDETWAEKKLLSTDNERMPAEVKQIHEYNDLVFGAAGNRLVYSDLRSGVIVPWAFPAVNEIRVEGRVNFCGEINEVLLFGSRDGLWRLAGNTEYNFAVGQISNSGPIDGYAWSKITDALAFVGEGGLFVTDASQVIRASETVLDDFFQDKKVVRGAVAFFKDGDVLYSVTLEDSDGNTEDVQFKREDGYWVRWNLPFMQSASIVEGNKATLVLVADGTGRLKRLDWNSTANEEDDVAWSWTSQFLDEPGRGIGLGNPTPTANRRKRYSQFQFTGEAANTMLLQIWKDNEVDPAVEKTFESRANLIPVRVPINRIARRLRFKLSGRGRVKIQGMQVVII